MIKKTYKITGMHCTSCAKMIELELEDIGIKGKCNYAKETLEIESKSDDKDRIKEAVEKAGYSLA